MVKINRVLYISHTNHLDYQDDCLFIGLRELFGDELVDVNKKPHSYDSFSSEEAQKMYGKGMTVTRVLTDMYIDRNDITKKIKGRYFDLIVYGSITRCQDYLSLVIDNYGSNKIILVDGEDEQELRDPFAGLGLPYFKRELKASKANVFPINFAIPTKKYVPNFFNKTRDIAYCDPRDRNTYIYKDEESYYAGYRESRFAFTMKKAGWDSMRHYEIIANGALPLFLDIDGCPDTTMTSFNKEITKNILLDLRKNESPKAVYEKYAWSFFNYAQNNNTTIALGKAFINQCSQL